MGEMIYSGASYGIETAHSVKELFLCCWELMISTIVAGAWSLVVSIVSGWVTSVHSFGE